MVVDLVSIFDDATIEKYAGQWVAIVDNKIVAAGTNCEKVYNESKRKFKTEPLLHRVFGKELIIV